MLYRFAFCLLLLATTFALRAQTGTILAFNRLAGTFTAPVTLPDGTGAGSAGARVQFQWVLPDGSLIEVGPSIGFRGSSGALALYFDGGQMEIPGTKPRDNIIMRVRAWVGASWDSATMRGESPDFSIQLGGAQLPGSIPSNLQGFTLIPAGVAPPASKPITPQLTPDGQFTASLTMGNSTIQFVKIQSSVDLNVWTTIATNRLEINGTTLITVPVQSAHIFYRAVAAPEITTP